MKISKIFVEVRISNDCEGRNWNWKTTTKTYEKAVENLKAKWDGWFEGVRLVEKIFNSDTFEITIRVIKETHRTYKDFSWDGGIEEKVF